MTIELTKEKRKEITDILSAAIDGIREQETNKVFRVVGFLSEAGMLPEHDGDLDALMTYAMLLAQIRAGLSSVRNHMREDVA